jgi:small-conductance mechanosensitive channel
MMMRIEVFFLDVLSALSNPDYYFPFFIAIAWYVGLSLAKSIFLSRLKKISESTDTILDDVAVAALEATRQFFILGFSLFVGFQTLHLDKTYGHIADKILVIIISLQVIIWGMKGIGAWIELSIQKKNNDPSFKTSLNFIGLLFKFIFISAVFLFALNNLGINVSTFIAGLGVGGIAIALATQNILGDLFSSLSIVMDKPFVVGDYISLGEWMGTIEHIGLKTTRLRSISGEQIIISNSDLLSSKIRNFKRMAERRVVLQLGLTYQTKREDLRRAPKIVEDIIKEHERTRFDRAHFMRYGAFSLDIEVVYWVLSPEFKDYASINESILFKIHEEFEKNNLEFAYPTQTLFLEKRVES